jgi:2-dehydro-3-deoxyphosphogluconate aldolase/(4S)-4-hydroxy-2-oxoglutarate aldolase
MTREQTAEKIIATGLIPVVRAASTELALQAAEAIYRGGVSIVEITMTVPGAIRVMERVAEKLGGQVVLGAGTILDAETARAAMLAGAEFIVAPSLNLKVIEIAHRYSKVVVPGALTPTEVLAAWEAGADFVKIFPAGSVGGAKYIKALKAPFPHILLVPTGGVNLETAADFLLAGASALGVGAELCDAKALAAGRPEVVEENARKFLAVVRKARAATA